MREDCAALPSDRQRKNLLLDFYGGLLTEKQRECFALRYADDLSLVEIGEQCGVTPQAVVDLSKRTAALLDKYERALSLVKKWGEQRVLAQAIDEELTAIARAGEAAGLDGLAEMTARVRASVDGMVL